MSIRTNIRNAAATALTSALVVPTANILRGRNNTIASISFPSAAIYAVTEQIDVRTLGPSNRTQYRQLQLVVDYFIAESGTYLIDDLFDTGSAAVEAAILADVTLGGVCRDTHLTNVEYTQEPNEEVHWGSARHTFNCIYLTND